MKVKYFVFNHLLSFMFRQCVESHHQPFLNNSLNLRFDFSAENPRIAGTSDSHWIAHVKSFLKHSLFDRYTKLCIVQRQIY